MKRIIYLILILTGFAFKANAQTPTADTIMDFNTPLQAMPAFPGGAAGYNAFIKANVHYPAQALKDKVEGRAIITFVVEKDGTLSNFKAGHDPDSGLADEAIRVLKLSPKWSPGMNDNKPVRARFGVPVTFNLPKASQ